MGEPTFRSTAKQSSSIEQLKLLFTQRESAQVLAVSLRTVQHLIDSGLLPAKRIGRRVLVHRKDLEAFARADHPCTGRG